ncbi:hypothetical protein D3C80_1046060 [compost metagenome]
MRVQGELERISAFARGFFGHPSGKDGPSEGVVFGGQPSAVALGVVGEWRRGRARCGNPVELVIEDELPAFSGKLLFHEPVAAVVAVLVAQPAEILCRPASVRHWREHEGEVAVLVIDIIGVVGCEWHAVSHDRLSVGALQDYLPFLVLEFFGGVRLSRCPVFVFCDGLIELARGMVSRLAERGRVKASR